jgi:hypothetical protein
MRVTHMGEAGAEEPRTFAATASPVVTTSTPNGAEIEVDGALLGHTPAEVPLACGEGLISITKQGLQTLANKVTGTAAE